MNDLQESSQLGTELAVDTIDVMVPSSRKGLEVDSVYKKIDSRPILLGIDLKIDPGESVTLLGPSGCGKTTLLRVIAGLERPEAGAVRLGDQTLSDPHSFMPPEKRQIGMVFQDWALFPHLDVAHNVSYGLAKDNENRETIVENILEMVGLSGLGSRMPSTLSGGEKQRVAIARSLAPQPHVLLLDEPFSNLDTSLRASVRSETRSLLRDLGMTTLFVTHDQEEAFILSDEIAVMDSGVIRQQASPHEIYERPHDLWVAAFIGNANLLPGLAEGTTAQTVLGAIPLAKSAFGPQTLLLRPEQIHLEPGSSAQVKRVEFYGHGCTYWIDFNGTELIVRSTSKPSFTSGETVALTYQGPGVAAYPKESSEKEAR